MCKFSCLMRCSSLVHLEHSMLSAGPSFYSLMRLHNVVMTNVSIFNSTPVTRHCSLIVSRSSDSGPNVWYRTTVPAVSRPSFQGAVVSSVLETLGTLVRTCAVLYPHTSAITVCGSLSVGSAGFTEVFSVVHLGIVFSFRYFFLSWFMPLPKCHGKS